MALAETDFRLVDRADVSEMSTVGASFRGQGQAYCRARFQGPAACSPNRSEGCWRGFPLAESVPTMDVAAHSAAVCEQGKDVECATSYLASQTFANLSTLSAPNAGLTSDIFGRVCRRSRQDGRAKHPRRSLRNLPDDIQMSLATSLAGWLRSVGDGGWRAGGVYSQLGCPAT